jgi:hypothetical protein
MKLILEEFNGIAPSIHPRKLADSLAVTSQNTRLDKGTIEPFKGVDYIIDTTNGSKTLYMYQGNREVSTTSLDVVGALRPNDIHDRVYYAGGVFPGFRSDALTFRLGLPKPPSVSASIVTAGNMANTTDVFNTRYVVTLVDTFGHEGPPSTPTPSLELGLGFEVSVNLVSATVTGNYSLGVGALYRIYRSNTSNVAGAIYQFVGEVAYGTGAFSDTVLSSNLQEAILTTNWNAAPDDDLGLYPSGPLASLVEMPGGILIGHSGNTIHVSEPYVPTAWPYRYTTSSVVVGCTIIQGGALILTTGSPYILTGSDPSALATVPVESDQACVSKRSIVNFGTFAMYASPDGLVLAQGNSAELVTEDFISRDEWSTFCGGDPSSIRAFQYEGKYIAFYGATSSATGFIFDPKGGKSTLTTLSGYAVDGAWYNSAEDRLEVIYVDGGQSKIGHFNEGADLTYTRLSKKYLFGDPIGLQLVRLEADAYPISLQIYADGVSKGTWNVPDSQVLRLPGGFRAREYQFELVGTGAITGVFFADNMAEII